MTNKANTIQLKWVEGSKEEMAINPEKVVLVELDDADILTIWFDSVVTLYGENFICVKGDFDDLVYRLTTPDGGWDSD